MTFDILTALPALLSGPFHHSILQRAIKNKLLEVNIFDLRAYGLGKHKQIDDYQYGGGAGMVLMVEPLYNAIRDLSSQHTYDEIIYLCPDGEILDQPLANKLSLKDRILLICGHYKGIDERIREYCVTRELSIGNYVLSGGELAAAVVVDTVGRLLPGVLNDEASALSDSFQDDLIAPPVYTRPDNFNGWQVPAVLLSGHAKEIERWRYEQSLLRTKERRPEMLEDE